MSFQHRDDMVDEPFGRQEEGLLQGQRTMEERRPPMQYSDYAPTAEQEKLAKVSQPYTPSQITSSENVRMEGKKETRSIFNMTAYLLLLVVLATALFAFTSWFVRAAFSGEAGVRVSQALSKLLKWEVGDALAVLRVSQGVLSTVTTLALMTAFELIQWALASRERGVSVSSFLGLSPTTAPWGVAMVALSRASRLPERLWGTIR
jgi:hypothetical protein